MTSLKLSIEFKEFLAKLIREMEVILEMISSRKLLITQVIFWQNYRITDNFKNIPGEIRLRSKRIPKCSKTQLFNDRYRAAENFCHASKNSSFEI